MTIKVLVADAQCLAGSLLGIALNRYKDLDVIPAHPTTGLLAIEVIIAARPNVSLIDYWMPDFQGPRTVESILRLAPDSKILLTSWIHGADHVRAALKAGATGFLPKSSGLEEVANAIRSAHRGDALVFGNELAGLVQRMDRRQADSDRVAGKLQLTPREIQVLGLLSRGSPPNEIAKQLFLSPRTINDHIHNLIGKLGVRSSAQAVVVAKKIGIIGTASDRS